MHIPASVCYNIPSGGCRQSGLSLRFFVRSLFGSGGFSMVKRNVWWLCGLLGLTIFWGAAFLFMNWNKYRGAILIAVVSEGDTPFPTDTKDDREILKSTQELLTSRPVLEHTLRSPFVMRAVSNSATGHAHREEGDPDLVEWLQKRLSVRMVPMSAVETDPRWTNPNVSWSGIKLKRGHLVNPVVWLQEHHFSDQTELMEVRLDTDDPTVFFLNCITSTYQQVVDEEYNKMVETKNRPHIKIIAMNLPHDPRPRLNGPPVPPMTEEERRKAALKRFDEPLIVTSANLSGEKVTDTKLANLNGLTEVDPAISDNLKTLFLCRSKVSDAGLVHLERLTKLQELDLTDTKVSDAGLVHLKGLTKLQSLRLRDTKVSDAGLVHLKGLTKLQELDLTDTKVSDAGLSHLKGFTELQSLNLCGTNVTNAGLSHLKGRKRLAEHVLLAVISLGSSHDETQGGAAWTSPVSRSGSRHASSGRPPSGSGPKATCRFGSSVIVKA